MSIKIRNATIRKDKGLSHDMCKNYDTILQNVKVQYIYHKDVNDLEM